MVQIKPEPDEWNGLDLTYHPDLRMAVKKVVCWHQSGKGAIVLAGGYGCGKTHMAEVIYKFNGGPIITLNALFYAEPKLFGDIRQSYSGRGQQNEVEIIRKCQQCKILIIDDLGIAHVKEESISWAQDIYWRLFDTRSKNNRPMMITTNLTMPQLFIRIGARAADRLMGMMESQENFVEMFNIPSYRLKGWKK